MDDRVARILFEDNILVRQKRAEADIALLQKLSTISSIVLQTLPVPGGYTVGTVIGDAVAAIGDIPMYSNVDGQHITPSPFAVNTDDQLIAPVGSAAFPSYSFTGRTNDGIWSFGDGAIAVTVNNENFAIFDVRSPIKKLLLYGLDANDSGGSVASSVLDITVAGGTMIMAHLIDDTNKYGIIQVWEAGVGYNKNLSLQPYGGVVIIGSGGLQANGDITIANAKNIVVDTSTGTKIGTATNQKLGFFGATPVTQPTEITDELTTLTHTAPGTPDYAIQNLVDSSGGAAFGFATQDEGNTVLSVIANLQTRVKELEDKLVSLGLLADAD